MLFYRLTVLLACLNARSEEDVSEPLPAEPVQRNDVTEDPSSSSEEKPTPPAPETPTMFEYKLNHKNELDIATQSQILRLGSPVQRQLKWNLLNSRQR